MGEMTWMETVYLICFFVGLGFAILSGLLAGVFTGGADMGGEVGGPDADIGDAGVNIGDGSVHFSPLSPVTIAMFIATFGGSGYIFSKVLGWPLLFNLPAATVSGFLLAAIVFYLFYKLFQATQASSQPRVDEVVGKEAQITVPIPNHGVGQIAYSIGGMRYSNSAQTADGKELPVNMIVKVVKRVGNTFIVEKSQ